MGESLASPSSDSYSRWGKDDTETRRLLARYPAPGGNAGTDAQGTVYVSDRGADGRWTTLELTAEQAAARRASLGSQAAVQGTDVTLPISLGNDGMRYPSLDVAPPVVVSGRSVDAMVEVPAYDAMGNQTGYTVPISASPNAMGYVEQMSRLGNALHVPQGFAKNTYDQAVAGMMNRQNNWGRRVGETVRATVALPLAFGEELVRGVLNVPSAAADAIPLAAQAGTNAARAMDSRLPTFARVEAGLTAVRDGAFAFTGLGGAAAVVRPGLEIGRPPAWGELAMPSSRAPGEHLAPENLILR